MLIKTLEAGGNHKAQLRIKNSSEYRNEAKTMDHNYGKMGFVVCLANYNPQQYNGTLAYLIDCKFRYEQFNDLSDLLFHIDAICDEEGHPHRDTILRTSLRVPQNEKRIVFDAEPIHFQRCIAVELVVFSRSHSSIQGFIRRGSNRLSFRSGIECMKLLRELKFKHQLYIPQKIMTASI